MSNHHGWSQRGLLLQPLLRHGFRTAIRVLLSDYETLVGAPRRIQSRTSAGWNLLPRTPNFCATSRPRLYARRTVSSWQPMYSATSNAVMSRFGSPLFADVTSAGGCVVSAVCADSVQVVFLIAPSAQLRRRTTRSTPGSRGRRTESGWCDGSSDRPEANGSRGGPGKRP